MLTKLSAITPSATQQRIKREFPDIFEGQPAVPHRRTHRVRHEDAARLRHRFEPGRHIDGMPEYIVRLHNHIAQIYPDPEQELSTTCPTPIPDTNRTLELDGRPDRRRRAHEDGQESIPGILDGLTVPSRHHRLNDVVPYDRTATRRACLVSAMCRL
jgi:hypothetical protein